MNRLICGDALAVLQALPAGSLDLVYLDPPFATGKTRRGAGGAYEDPSVDELMAMLGPIFGEIHRCLAPRGSLFVHLDHRAVHHAFIALERLFGADRLVNEIVWCYSVGGKSRRGFGKKHDTILWFARDDAWRFDADAVRVARRAGSHMKVERDEEGRAVQVKRDRKTGKVYKYPVHEGKIPEDWWADIETLNRGDRERTGWPTQKPERLLSRIIAAASEPGGRVADFFSGSGTTAVVAAKLGRSFLAVDRSGEACRLAQKRLAEAGCAVEIEPLLRRG